MEKIVKEMEQFLGCEGKKPHEAYVAGFRAANALHGYVTPDELDVENYIRQKILFAAADEYWTRREEARTLLKQYGVNKPHFRAMIFDCAAVNDAGKEIDPVIGTVLAPGEHHGYCSMGWFTSTIDADGVHDVPYVPLKDETGKTVLKVHKTDRPFIDELLWRDIQICDPINEAYFKESQPGGKLEEYRETIIQALLDVKPEYPAVKRSGWITMEKIDVDQVIAEIVEGAKAEAKRMGMANESFEAFAKETVEKIARVMKREVPDLPAKPVAEPDQG